MALTKNTVEGHIRIHPDGIVMIKRTVEILEDGELLTTKNQRSVITPGDDYSNYPARIRAILDVVHTQAVIDAYAAANA